MSIESRIGNIPVNIASDYRKRRLARAYVFFREHGGGWVGHSAESAWRLAKAELAAEDLGWECRWQYDEECSRDEGREMSWCGLYDADGRVLAGLGGIEDPCSSAYQRVVEAELALDAVDEHATRLAAEMATRATYAAG